MFILVVSVYVCGLSVFVSFCLFALLFVVCFVCLRRCVWCCLFVFILCACFSFVVCVLCVRVLLRVC